MIIFFLSFNLFPELKIQISRSFDRVETINEILEGDMTAGGTLARLNIRSPRVIRKFKENPLVGFGYSDEGYDYQDVHVGNQSILVEGGLIGLILIVILLLTIIYSIYVTKRKLSNGNPYKKALPILIFGLVGVFVIHSSSMQWFGYYISGPRIFFISIYFTFMSLVIRNSLYFKKTSIK